MNRLHAVPESPMAAQTRAIRPLIDRIRSLRSDADLRADWDEGRAEDHMEQSA